MTLLPSLAFVFLFGLVLGKIAEKLGLPTLVGYLLAGISLGSSGFSLISEELLVISADLRKIALVMILLKAGLTLQWERLKKIGKPAVLLSFVPASWEIFSCILVAPLFFELNFWESALLGTVLAAVSPAVVVPRMVSYVERGLGKNGQAPEIVLAGASLDDVFVIVLFTALLPVANGGVFSLDTLLDLPVSVILAVLLGVFLGKTLSKWKLYLEFALEQKILLLLGISFGLLGIEEHLPLSALLTIMIMAMCLEKDDKLSADFTSLWKGAELLLFVLVGAEVQVAYIVYAGGFALIVLGIGLVMRGVGVFLATTGANLTKKERVFVTISYLPKATVQAGIGGIPLAMGMDCGELVLTFAVLAIFVTAPFGAWLLDKFGEKLLLQGENERKYHEN